jgi:hypothetical protein
MNNSRRAEQHICWAASIFCHFSVLTAPARIVFTAADKTVINA